MDDGNPGSEFLFFFDWKDLPTFFVDTTGTIFLALQRHRNGITFLNSPEEDSSDDKQDGSGKDAGWKGL